MKLDFFKRTQTFGKKFCLPLLLCLGLIPLCARAGLASTNFNSTIIGIPPQVDATNFINSGTWNIETAPYPYETRDTLNYTNTGNMNGAVGWEFDLGPISNGGRGWSASFYNGPYNPPNGVVSSSDLSFLLINQESMTVSYLLISATNIVNKGLLAAGPNGEIILNGSEVDLSRSELEITPLVGRTGGISTSTNFTPDTAIYDEFWQAAVSNKVTVTGSPWDGTTVAAFTFYNVQEPCGEIAPSITIGPLTPQLADSLETDYGSNNVVTTNSDLVTTESHPAYSNIVRQAIFVLVSDTNIIPSDRFGQKLNATNLFNPRAVQFATVSTNVVTGMLETNTIYLVDTLGASTNEGLAANLIVSPSAPCTSPTYRPATVEISRTDDGTFANGFVGMGPPAPIFFYDSTFSNRVAYGIADVYSASVDNLAAEPPLGFSITNAPGRIHIYANNLNLSKTRISAASEILIQATNLISSAGAVMDCQNLSYNFGSTNGLLNVINLAGTDVQRLNGTITEHSDLWTNYIVTVYPNFVTNSSATNAPFDTEADITNVTEVDIAITVVDASGLTTIRLVTVQDLILHSTNMIVSDSMNVANSLLFDGQSLTIQGSLFLSGTLRDWNSAIAPNLRFFTNNGDLTIPNDAHFGDDRAANYAAFVNHGFISAAGQTINSDYLEINGGTNKAFNANFVASCQTGLVANAEIAATGDIQFFANSLQIDPSTLFAGGAIDFTVTNSLSDAGSANAISCQSGFNLYIKPTTGDLLGTTITDIALGQNKVNHTWAGNDLGATIAGYANNVAIGTLILNQNDTNGFFTPLFHFTGANAANGLYVSNLDLSSLSDYTNELQIDPNLTIYFMSATINPTIKTLSADQFLNGQFGNHLRWVQNGGATNTVVSGSMMTNGKFKLNFTGSGSTTETNIVEASTNLINWTPIYTNLGSMTFTDSAANSYPHRFYRVITSP